MADACSRPPITIKSHDLQVGDIRRALGEKTSTTMMDFSLGSCGLCVFWPSLFVSPVMVLAFNLLLDFCSIA